MVGTFVSTIILSLQPVGVLGFFMELLARFVCISAWECALIMVLPPWKVASGARLRRI